VRGQKKKEWVLSNEARRIGKNTSGWSEQGKKRILLQREGGKEGRGQGAGAI
jgi:hypothetical protein